VEIRIPRRAIIARRGAKAAAVAAAFFKRPAIGMNSPIEGAAIARCVHNI
jgi:hypothetical protein